MLLSLCTRLGLHLLWIVAIPREYVLWMVQAQKTPRLRHVRTASAYNEHHQSERCAVSCCGPSQQRFRTRLHTHEAFRGTTSTHINITIAGLRSTSARHGPLHPNLRVRFPSPLAFPHDPDADCDPRSGLYRAWNLLWKSVCREACRRTRTRTASSQAQHSMELRDEVSELAQGFYDCTKTAEK